MCLSLWGSHNFAMQCILNTVLCARSAGAGAICTAKNTKDERLVVYQVLEDILHVTHSASFRQHARSGGLRVNKLHRPTLSLTVCDSKDCSQIFCQQ